MKEPSKNKSADTDWEIDIQSCSATDCTGLIPALPESDAELEHYQDLYHYLPDEKNESDFHGPYLQNMHSQLHHTGFFL